MSIEGGPCEIWMCTGSRTRLGKKSDALSQQHGSSTCSFHPALPSNVLLGTVQGLTRKGKRAP
ncbi:hypothetical protein SAY87_027211 [Trapa incisa]|uniref:Uncharacterized protein n=1 Tax=Trapa incisa TaxID=236973 RepID=A0AAN7GYV1_9MYRT|nr:hypothetical protein SAY87_027211 [Trapa incisa]